MAKIFSVLFLPLLLNACNYDPLENRSPAPSEIFGNPTYRAISFGGYRGLTREEGPNVEQLIDDVKILDAMGVKLLRTYNTSQFPRKLPRQMDSSKLEFSADCCLASMGVRSPNASWGLSSLYSIIHHQVASRTWSSDVNRY
jgi:hypothetical protein